MHSATLTSKGQITVPLKIREKLRLHAGSRLVFEEQPNGDILVRRQAADSLSLKGILPKPPRALSIEEIDEAIGTAVVERSLRSTT